MPEITDPATLAAIARQQQGAPQARQPQPMQVQPQPFPGAQPITVQRAPGKVLAEQQAQSRMGIDQNQDARAAEQLQMDRERAERQAREFAIKEKNLAANSGVETGVGQDQAAGHAIMLVTNLQQLQELGKKDPRALVPTWTEKAARGMSNNDPDVVGWAQSGDRQVADTAYSNALESAIWLSTGAAAPEDQVKRLAKSITPGMFDKPETLRYKQKLLQAYIEQAKTRAGPANAKVNEALSALEQSMPMLYEPKLANINSTPQEMKLSDSQQATPIPPEMQAEYSQWLQGKRPGELTVGDYINFRRQLDAKYEFSRQQDYPGVDEMVKAFNAKQPVSDQLPAANTELGALGSASAAVSGSAAGVFVKNLANAGALGVPELLAGREGRYASQLADESSPIAAVAGDIAGSIAPTIALEKLAGAGLRKAGMSTISRDIGADIAANAGYGTARGFNEAETGNRFREAAIGGGLGLVGTLAARGLTKGAKGFMGETKANALDDLGEKQFDLPPERQPLPADDITPPRFQAMTDDELVAEVAKAKQGIDAWAEQGRMVGQKSGEQLALRADVAKFAKENTAKQLKFYRNNRKLGMTPEEEAEVWKAAAEQFPDNPEQLMGTVFAKQARQTEIPAAPNIDDVDTLKQRIARLEQQLAQNPTGSKGTIPPVDLTTMQRAGMESAEETLQGLPGIGKAREAAVESWNKQNSARVLARIGKELPKDIEAGQAMNAHVNKELNAAYNQIRPLIKGRVDRGFENGWAAIRKNALSNPTPERQALMGEIDDALSKFRKADGTFDGEGYRELSTQLRRLTDVWSNNTNPAQTVAAQDMARVAEQVRKQAQALVNRANPAVGKRLKQVEGAWAHQVRIEDASRRGAKSTRGVYAPDEYLNSIERLDTSKGKTAVSRGKGFDQPYAQNAREIIGGKPAKKPSLQSTLIAGGALAGGYFSPALTGAVATALGASYTPGVKRLVQAIIDGKLGKTPKAVEKALTSTATGRTLSKGISADSRQKLLEQLVRAEGQRRRDDQ